MSRTSLPTQPKEQKKSAVGRVLGFIRGKGKSTPPTTPPPTVKPMPPPTTSPTKVTIGTNRGQPTQTPPTSGADPFQGVKDRIAQARRELALLTTHAFAAPKGVTDKLQASDDLVKRATKAEDFGAALQALNEGLRFAPAAKAYADDRAAAALGRDAVSRLPYVKHPVLVDYAAHIKKCLKQADAQFAAATTPEAVAAPCTTLQGVVASMVPETVNANKALAAADGAIKKAQAALAPFIDYQFLDMSAAKTKIEPARAAFDSATTAQEATDAVSLLKGFDADLKAAKSAGKDGLKAAEKYASQRNELMDEVAAAAKLRGANTDPDIKKLITDAKAALDDVMGSGLSEKERAELHQLMDFQVKKKGLLGGTVKSMDERGQRHSIETEDVKDYKSLSDADWKNINAAMQKVLKLKEDLLPKTGPDGQPLFTEADLADELFTPLVREGLMPETQGIRKVRSQDRGQFGSRGNARRREGFPATGRRPRVRAAGIEE
jgi:predicted TIM-barrel enzyme